MFHDELEYRIGMQRGGEVIDFSMVLTESGCPPNDE